MHITRYVDRDPLSQGTSPPTQQAGVPATDDYNGPRFEGVAYLQYNTRRGWRRHVADNYLRPAMSRPNLTVETHALAQRIVLEGGRATGLVYRKDGAESSVRVRREVLLAAGAIQSPQVLELSASAPPEILHAPASHPFTRCRAWGENLRDHLHVRIGYETNLPVTLNTIMRSPLERMKMGARWLFPQPRPHDEPRRPRRWQSPAAAPTCRAPDIKMQLHQLSMASSHYADNRARARSPSASASTPWPGFSIGTYVLRPESQGSVHIRAPDANEPPEIPRELPLSGARRHHHARGVAHDPPRRGPAGAGAVHRARDAAGTGGAGRRGAARARARHGYDFVPPDRHLPHGQRRAGRRRCDVASARRSRRARLRRVDHADHGGFEHPCADDPDR
jgi:choline dehydrogenase